MEECQVLEHDYYPTEVERMADKQICNMEAGESTEPHQKLGKPLSKFVIGKSTC